MNFISSFFPSHSHSEPAWWFLFQRDRILVHVAGGTAQIPRIRDPQALHIAPIRTQYLGTLDDMQCYAAEINAQYCEAPTDMAFLSLRKIFGMIPDDLFRIACRASAVMYWDRTYQFCGQCGRPVQFSTVERAKVCPGCGLTSYPRISPAVIVAVTKDRQILLAHGKGFPGNFYSVLAGFVEPGETFEDCVVREIKEEVGVHVDDIRYFGSQPWPFPDSLMVAFTARYAGGDIIADNKEVTDARWFTTDDLPDIPGKISISRQLIDWFAEKYK